MIICICIGILLQYFELSFALVSTWLRNVRAPAHSRDYDRTLFSSTTNKCASMNHRQHQLARSFPGLSTHSTNDSSTVFGMYKISKSVDNK